MGDSEEESNSWKEVKMGGVRKSLNVLVMSLPAFGHLKPLLAVGEQLVKAGHNVTFITTDGDKNHEIPARIERLGMTYVSAGESVMSYQLAKKDARSQSSLLHIIKAMITYLPQEFGTIIESASNYVNGHKVDIIIGEDFLQPALLCLSTEKDIKTVMVGTTLQIQPHSLPPWPWPLILSGAISDNLSFFERLFVTVITPFFP